MVTAHVNDLRCFLGTPEGGLHNSLWLAHEGNDGTVGGFARVNVEQLNALYRLDGISNLFDNAHVAPLAEVGHALDNLFFHSLNLQVISLSNCLQS